MDSHWVPDIVPLIPLREQVAFPHMVSSLYVEGDDMGAIERALQDQRILALFYNEKSSRSSDQGHLATIGTLCRINQVQRFNEDSAKITFEGLARGRLGTCVPDSHCLMARVTVLEEPVDQGVVAQTLVQSVYSLLKVALSHGRPLPGDVMKMVERIEEPGRLADLIAVYLALAPAVQQHMLEILNPVERLKEVYLILSGEIQKQQVRSEIQDEVSRKIGKNQKEYLLREQMKQIQEELGDDDPRQSEIDEFRSRLDRTQMPPDALRVAEREMARFERLHPASPEYGVARNYLESLVELPWNRSSEDVHDIPLAQTILDEDHFDLKEVKERILEFLAVRSLRPQGSKGPILCFVGAPGVGKTSLGRSIARALGRRFIRIALGGMKDEAEVRGHRRTYIGAMPGRIVQEISRAGVNNPVFMLDEIDKIGHDFRGDPSSALLEVLDPEQNNTFRDHYLDVPFDLSQVMFITTANTLDPIPAALRDRLEIVRLSGYGDEEKEQIAVRYLIPKQIEENGLMNFPPEFHPEALRAIIRDYTREAGVRHLERQIAGICRKLAKEMTLGLEPQRQVTVERVGDLLGPCAFFSEIAEDVDRVGVATGLAWTESGGDIIFVEVTRMPGRKELTLTGRLGEVMQESARAALSFVRANAERLGIDGELFEHSDFHVHVPAGAVPKDGPSAGITLAVALVSLLTGRPVRRRVALTGELTLSGRVLPVGGVKEKILAARRAGVATALLPRRNQAQVEALDKGVVGDLEIQYMETADDALATALLPVERVRGSFTRFSCDSHPGVRPSV